MARLDRAAARGNGTGAASAAARLCAPARVPARRRHRPRDAALARRRAARLRRARLHAARAAPHRRARPARPDRRVPAVPGVRRARARRLLLDRHRHRRRVPVPAVRGVERSRLRPRLVARRHGRDRARLLLELHVAARAVRVPHLLRADGDRHPGRLRHRQARLARRPRRGRERRWRAGDGSRSRSSSAASRSASLPRSCLPTFPSRARWRPSSS